MARLILVALVVISSTEQLQARLKKHNPSAKGLQSLIRGDSDDILGSTRFLVRQDDTKQPKVSELKVLDNPTHANASGFIIPREDSTHPNASGFIIPRESLTHPTGFITPKENSNRPKASGFIFPRGTSRKSRGLKSDLPALPASLEESKKMKREEQNHVENLLGKSRLQMDRRAVSCGPHILQPGTKVTIATKRFPRPYPAGYKCFWSFQVAGSPNDGKLQLQCTTFLLPSCWRGSWRWRRRCRGNYLALSHSSTNMYKKYFGRKGPDDVTTEGGVLKLFLSTVRGFRARGFSCSVEAFAGSTTTTTTTTPAPEVDVCELAETRCGINHRRNTNRIVSGQNAGVGAWPWVGGLTLRGDSGVFCGATLIHPEWALTAAHCAEAIKTNGVEADLLLGAHDLLHPQPQLQRRQITDLNSHPLYDSSTLDNDIALVRLASPAIMTEHVHLACLSPERSLQSRGIVTGWGLLEEGGSSAQILQEAEVGVVEWAECRKAYGSELKSSMLCAGGALGDACQGDSGGGLVFQAPSGRWAVAGVVSWGYGCARPGYPGVYANVRNFLPWVKITTGLAKCQRPGPSTSSSTPDGITTTTTTTVIIVIIIIIQALLTVCR
ncbi:transmembrane protease serine 11B-like protein [Penaeus monodon]|uniref:transmembrane protease serine 11B-like protein n=1 Tax=Penaeus monodon TaxID=6687 RepID=UPI0018A793B6|nr:transmembrane protease serine 11B-like protein [Penaeus monodon]